MWVYSTDRTKLEEILTAINSGLGYPTSTVTTWARIIESFDSNGDRNGGTYLMRMSEFNKQYLTSEQLNLVVTDCPSGFQLTNKFSHI